MKAPSKLALYLIDGVEHRAIQRAAQGLPTANRNQIALDIEEELSPLMDALKQTAITLHYLHAREKDPVVIREIQETLLKVDAVLRTF